MRVKRGIVGAVGALLVGATIFAGCGSSDSASAGGAIQPIPSAPTTAPTAPAPTPKMFIRLADLPDGWWEVAEGEGSQEGDERLCDLRLGDPTVRAEFSDGDNYLKVASATRATEEEAAAVFAALVDKARKCEPMERKGLTLTARVAKFRTVGDESLLLRFFADDMEVGAGVLIRSGQALAGITIAGLFKDHNDLLPYVELAEERLAT